MTEHGNGNGESPPEDWTESIPPEWGEPVSSGGREMPEPEVEPSASEIAEQRIRMQLVGFTGAAAFDDEGWVIPVPARKWAIQGMLPLGDYGLFVGPGGIGKGLTETALASHLALGLPISAVRWSRGRTPEPVLLPVGEARGVLLVVKEDDEPEMLRRIQAHHALRLGAEWQGRLSLPDREALACYLHIIALRSPTIMDRTFLRLLAERAKQIPDLAWIALDPLGRFPFCDSDGRRIRFVDPEFGDVVAEFCEALGEQTGGCVTPVAHMTRAARRAQREGGEAARAVRRDPFGTEYLRNGARFTLGLEPIVGNDLEDLRLSPAHEWLSLGIGKANNADSNLAIVFEKEGGAVRVVDMSTVSLGDDQFESDALGDGPERSPGGLGFLPGEDVVMTAVARALSGSTSNPNARLTARTRRLLRAWAARGWATPKGTRWRILAPGTEDGDS